MTIQIKTIVLYGRNNKIRELLFRSGRLKSSRGDLILGSLPL